MKVAAFGLCVASFLTGIAPALADDCVRPDAQLPPTFGEKASLSGVPLGELRWTAFYQDKVLQSLIHTALGDNFNALIAMQRVLQASEEVTITRANQLPSLTAELAAPTFQVNGPLPSIFPHQDFAPSLTGTVSYEADLWGKLRSATAASRAQLLGTEDAREVVMVTLVDDVATAYFEMRGFDQELTVLDQLLTDRKRSLALAKDRFTEGQVSQLDVDQARSLVEGVEATLPQVSQELKDSEITISTLEGKYPQQSIPRGLPLTDQLALPDVPAVGVPSALLERRPDIREAEQQLIAQHAQIMVARASLFPQLYLSGSIGTGTLVVDGLFYGPHSLFALIPSLLYTIFNAGKQKAQMRAAEDEEKQDLYGYLSTVHRSFSEVTSNLAGYQNFKTEAARLTKLTATEKATVNVATARYYEGEGSYADVLDAQSRYLVDNITLIEGELAERLALVNLYAALGGGWEKT